MSTAVPINTSIWSLHLTDSRMGGTPLALDLMQGKEHVPGTLEARTPTKSDAQRQRGRRAGLEAYRRTISRRGV